MITIIVVILITYIYSFYIAPNKNIPEILKNINQKCIIGCNNCAIRGGNYIIEDKSMSKKMDNCLITSWNVSHFVMYAILGYNYPLYLPSLTALGITFEIYEHYRYDCADLMDIPSNIAGLCVGYMLSK